MENRYVRDFVEYYQNLGFDKIFIYDNNDVDGERFEDAIGDYMVSGFVETVDYRGRKVVQLKAYEDCYSKHTSEYDWIAFFDCDEYLTFVDKSAEIHSFLMQDRFLPFHAIHINWMVFGDNDLLDDDGRSVTERFKNPVLPLDFVASSYVKDRPMNDFVKTIVRGGVSSFIWSSPHTIRSNYLRCCNPEAKETSIKSDRQEFVFDTAYIRHYSTKTIGEWVKNKMRRGFPDQLESNWKNSLTLDLFFETNTRTSEKLAYAEHLINELKFLGETYLPNVTNP